MRESNKERKIISVRDKWIMDFLGLAIAIFNVSILYLRTWFTTTSTVPLQNIDLHFQNNVYCNPGVPVLFNSQPRNIYSKQVLYSLRPNLRSYVLRSDVIQTLRRNKINAIKKTRRSRRGGKSQIKVIALNHNRASYPPRSVDITNLIKIDTHKAFIEKADNLTFIYLNARSCRNKTLEINDLINIRKERRPLIYFRNMAVERWVCLYQRDAP